MSPDPVGTSSAELQPTGSVGSRLAGARRSGARLGAVRSIITALVAGIALDACSAPAAPGHARPAGAALEAAVTEEVQAVEETAEQAPPEYVARAREAWRAAAQASDWELVAQKIDALPELERSEPGTRYVRALAARRLGDCEHALSSLDGLADALPLLESEIDAMRAECQLAVGPFDSTTGELMTRVSLEGRLEAARTWERAGQHERALTIAGGILSEAEAGGSERVLRDVSVEARALRADVAERFGQLELARSDLRWLATVAVAPGADAQFERLSGTRLTKAERAERAATLAERGDVAGVERELASLSKAPGPAVSRYELVRARAWAHYRSRQDYAQAAKLFEQAASLGSGNRASDLFKAASAWSRGDQSKRAVAIYDQIVRSYPNSRAAEQALHSKAHTFYSSGRWGQAVRAYTQYLSRYERPKGKKGKRAKAGRFVLSSRYERAISWLANGDHAQAREAFAELRKVRRSGYSPSLLEHLEAVALASSGVARHEKEAVARFQHIAERYPLSFAALSSSARLAAMGEPAPAPPPLPAVVSQPSEWPELPAKARLLADLGLNSAAELTLHEEEPALRARYSARAGETLCRQYESLDRGWRRYSLAAGIVDDGMLQRAPTTENLWAWQCLYPRPYASTVEQLEQRYQLPAGLVYSVMRQESEYRPEARSQVGAVGLMQLMPSTAERAARELMLEHESERLTQAEYNLELGSFYLGKLLHGFDERVVLAVSSYNAGPHAVSRWLEGQSKKLPMDIWAARIPYAETRNYVAKVMSNWARYRYLEGGPDAVPELALALPSGYTLPNDAY